MQQIPQILLDGDPYKRVLFASCAPIGQAHSQDPEGGDPSPIHSISAPPDQPIRILEVRDPNSGQSFDPEDKPRFQYLVIPEMRDSRFPAPLFRPVVLTRKLPAPRAGSDCWRGESLPRGFVATDSPCSDYLYELLEQALAVPAPVPKKKGGMRV